MRGDRPFYAIIAVQQDGFTPHARGSTPPVRPLVQLCGVYPACAGIDLGHSASFPLGSGLPRMRGDRPAFRDNLLGAEAFTPHARGSTLSTVEFFRPAKVYPACAGIDLEAIMVSRFNVRLPRMRGDRPSFPHTKTWIGKFTPHARGSTYPYTSENTSDSVYPACAGIDPDY